MNTATVDTKKMEVFREIFNIIAYITQILNNHITHDAINH